MVHLYKITFVACNVMRSMLKKIKQTLNKITVFLLTAAFLSSGLTGYGQTIPYGLPGPDQILGLSKARPYAVLQGLRLDPANPLKIEFIVDPGAQNTVSPEEASLLIRYFLAGLTIPEDDIWVNLSVHEQYRIIPEAMGQTDLGKNLLAQDYILKQLTASLTHPESDTGKDYWSKTYRQMAVVFGTTALPVNTFNKIWITPDKAEVYECENIVVIRQARLKACLEEDLLAMGKAQVFASMRAKTNDKINKVASDIMREVVVPKITEDVNSGKNFVTLRQVYHSLILAKWFKEKFKESFYKHYINQNKTNGIDLADKDAKEKIYNLYCDAFKKGLYDVIKQAPDPATKRIIKHRYFSGGIAELEGPLTHTPVSKGKIGSTLPQKLVLFTALVIGGITLPGLGCSSGDSGGHGSPAAAGAVAGATGGASASGTGGTAGTAGNPGATGGTSGTTGTTAPNEDPGPYLTFLRNNVSTVTGMPHSFYVPPDVAADVYGKMGADTDDDIIRRAIVAYGLNDYDGACWVMALLTTGLQSDRDLASVLTTTFWAGKLGSFSTIRAGYTAGNQAQPFIYDPNNPLAVSGNLADFGKRGYLFRTIDADGVYQPLVDPAGYTLFPVAVDGTTVIHWTDWQPVTGENAWSQMAAAKLYRAKYYDSTTDTYASPDAVELRLAIELARAALLLQADNGGVRMAPIGTYNSQGPQWWNSEESTENNFSQYAAFRMLYRIIGDPQYQAAMTKQEQYLKGVWDPVSKTFYQGMHFTNGVWQVNNSNFAVDCQTWAIGVLGPDVIDSWFGEGSAYAMWEKTKSASGYLVNGVLNGVGYTTESDQLSPEWTRGAIRACVKLQTYYTSTHPDWAAEAGNDVATMRAGLENFTYSALGGKGDSYSRIQKFIPFGWWAHDQRVLSTTSTSWHVLDAVNSDPFQLNISGRRPTPSSLAWAAGMGIFLVGIERLLRDRRKKAAAIETTVVTSLPPADSTTEVGGIKMSGISVKPVQGSSPVEFNAIGPEFFEHLTFKITGSRDIVSFSDLFGASTKSL
jgi:hypothetical protein